jgi:hypothetical protein
VDREARRKPDEVRGDDRASWNPRLARGHGVEIPAPGPVDRRELVPCGVVDHDLGSGGPRDRLDRDVVAGWSEASARDDDVEGLRE